MNYRLFINGTEAACLGSTDSFLHVLWEFVATFDSHSMEVELESYGGKSIRLALVNFLLAIAGGMAAADILTGGNTLTVRG